MAAEMSFWDAVERIRSRDDRYRRELYGFVMESLDFTIRQVGERRHVSANELLDGFCGYARERFGLMAGEVINAWGVGSPRDVGRVVFQLVDEGVLSRREEDAPEDFEITYDIKGKIEDNYFD